MYGKAQNNKEEKVTMKCYEASDEKRLRTYLHKEQLLAIDLDGWLKIWTKRDICWKILKSSERLSRLILRLRRSVHQRLYFAQ